MKFKFLFGGRERSDLLQEGIEDYIRRINKTSSTEVLYGRKEGDVTRFLNHLPQWNYLIGLAEEGKGFTSPQFAQFLQSLMERGTKEVIFLVGGVDGLEPGWRERCNIMLSLSPLTFSHQLARLVLLEQVYRAVSIIHKRPYHR